MDAICGYCEQRIGTNAVEHFSDQHPGMEWSLLTWPDGTPAHLDDRHDEQEG